MRKVPVIEVVRFSYLFLFGEFGTIVRLTWFPLGVVSALGFATGYLSIEAQVAARDFVTPPPNEILWSLLNNLVTVFAYSMVAVALHRVLLFNDRKPGTVLLFSLKRAEWLFIGFALVVGVAFVVLTAVLVGVGLGTGVATGAPGLAGVILAGFGLVGFYLFVRIWPIYPVIVVEERLNFRRAFELSRGNFWRLVGVSLLGTLPIAVVGGIAFFIYSYMMLGDLPALERDSPGDPFRAVGDAIQAYLMGVSIGGFVVSVVATGIGIPLICYSYKALRNIGPFEYLDENGAVINPGGTDL